MINKHATEIDIHVSRYVQTFIGDFDRLDDDERCCSADKIAEFSHTCSSYNWFFNLAINIILYIYLYKASVLLQQSFYNKSNRLP